MIKYQVEPDLSAAEFKQVLEESSLGERRPIDEMDRVEKMVTNADIIITARKNGKLVGVSRSVSDLTYCTYLSDLAVSKDCQHQGIGKKLIDLTQEYAPKATLILLAAPAAVDYYPKIGMHHHPHCHYLKEADKLK